MPMDDLLLRMFGMLESEAMVVVHLTKIQVMNQSSCFNSEHVIRS